MKTILTILLALSFACGATLAVNPPAKGQCVVEITAVMQEDQAQVWCVKVTTPEPAQFRIIGQGNHGGWGLGSGTALTKSKGSPWAGEVWIVTSLIFPANEAGGYLQTIATANGSKCRQMREVNHSFKLASHVNPTLAGKTQLQNIPIELGTMGELKLAIMVGEKSQEFRAPQSLPQNKSPKSN